MHNIIQFLIVFNAHVTVVNDLRVYTLHNNIMYIELILYESYAYFFFFVRNIYSIYFKSITST